MKEIEMKSILVAVTAFAALALAPCASAQVQGGAVAVRGPQGNELEFQVAPEVQMEGIQLGDLVTVVYANALALQMLPKESKAAAKSAKPG
jgi:hypothetical protein